LGHGASDGKQLPHDGAPPTEQTSSGRFIGIWNYPNNRPNIQTYALWMFTFSLQTFTIFFLINVFISIYYNFFDVYHIYDAHSSKHRSEMFHYVL